MESLAFSEAEYFELREKGATLKHDQPENSLVINTQSGHHIGQRNVAIILPILALCIMTYFVIIKVTLKRSI